MGAFTKSPKRSPGELAQIQAQIDAALGDQLGAWNETAKQSSIAAGKSVGWDQVQGQIKQTLQQRGITIPDGYDVDREGKLVYTNKTPYLQQAAWAASPFVAGYGAQALSGIVPAATSTAVGTAGTTAAVPPVATAVNTGAGSTLLKYGLNYGIPAAVNYFGTRAQVNAERDSNRALMDYYDKALDAEQEERDYRRRFDEDERTYGREFGEEGRRYGRYSDQYGRDSDEEKLRYGRYGDEYGRLSDEEKLAYGRAEGIRDKNYGYQQYGNFVETLEPFRAGGSAAASRMSKLMGGPATPDTGSYLNLARTARENVRPVPTVPDRPTWNYTANRPTWNYDGQPSPNVRNDTNQQPVSTTMPVSGGPQLIRVQAPDGETRLVTADMAAMYERLGAVRV